jgi:hypothetical protein
MKKIVDSFFLYHMGWIKPKNHFTLLSLKGRYPTFTSSMKSLVSLKADTPTYLEHGILGHGLRQMP